MADAEPPQPASAPGSEPIASEGPISTRAELKQVEERLAIPANVVYETVRREGDTELRRSAQALAWSGLAAGLSMGFSLVAEGLLAAHLPDRSWTPLLTKLGYAVGFLIVVLGRQQLFTENTLTVILPLLVRKDRSTLAAVARLWAVVLASNWIGTFLFAAIIGTSSMFGPHARAAFLAIGLDKLGIGFGVSLLRAIFAGWLIALMVWLLPAAESSKVWIIIILTYLIGLGSFNHVIAGSTTVLYAVVVGAASWSDYAVGFFLPSLLGNIIGGVALVAALSHAQVVGSKNDGTK